MTTETLPEALRFADALDWEGHEGMGKAANELRRQHDRIAELEAELVKEAAATAEQKLRADQMTEQHRMQCEIRAQLEACHGCAVQQGYKPAEALQGIGEPVEALRLADAIDPFARASAPDHLTMTVAAGELRRQHARIAALEAELAALKAAPASESWRTMVEGMSVSVDVSTGEHDAGNRYFGTVTEVMDDPESKHGVTLLIQDAEPNFALAVPQAQDVQLSTAPAADAQVVLPEPVAYVHVPSLVWGGKVRPVVSFEKYEDDHKDGVYSLRTPLYT